MFFRVSEEQGKLKMFFVERSISTNGADQYLFHQITIK